MSFAGSDGLFPQGDLARTIAGEYEVQCRQLCFGPYPPWEAVQARFEDLRESLGNVRHGQLRLPLTVAA